MIEHSDRTFNGAGDVPLYYQAWWPAGPVRGVVALVHGVLEHSDRYPALARHLPAQGYALAAFDLRGHGRSGGLRGHVPRWQAYGEDLACFLAEVASDAGGHDRPGLPRFLYGHSLGSLIVLDYVLARPGAASGAIISGVPLDTPGISSPLVRRMAILLSRVTPRLRLPLGNEPAHLTRDPEGRQATEADPLFQRRTSVRWGAETMAAVARIEAAAGRVQVPLLILHGEADPLSLVAGSRRLYRQVAAPGTTLHIYPGGLHEPHNDLQRETVMADVLAWLAERTGANDRQ